MADDLRAGLFQIQVDRPIEAVEVQRVAAGGGRFVDDIAAQQAAGERIAAEEEGVVAAAGERVVAAADVERIADAVAGDGVVERRIDQGVDLAGVLQRQTQMGRAARHRLRRGRAEVQCDRAAELREIELIDAAAGWRIDDVAAELSAGELEVGAAAARDERIVAAAGNQSGRAAAADQRVIAALPLEDVGRGVAVNPVIARGADDVLELADQR